MKLVKIQHKSSCDKEVKEEGLKPETFRGSALSSLSPLTGRATRGLAGQEGFLSGTAASPEPQRNTGSPNTAGHKGNIQYLTMACHKPRQT